MEKDIKLKLRLSRMDRSLLVALPITMLLVFFVLLAMFSAYQREAVVSTMRVSHTLAVNQRNQLDVYLIGRIEMLKLLAQQPDVYSMNLERQRAFAARWTESTGFSHIFLAQCKTLWDFGFRTYDARLKSMIFRNRYSSSAMP